MKDITNTQFFQVETGPQIQAKDILEIVYNALVEKGYNPVNQIVGYIMSGDPTYITSYNGLSCSDSAKKQRISLLLYPERRRFIPFSE